MAFLQDFRFALRMLWKDRGFTAAAVAALALGIGVNTTVFTFVNAVLIRGLPFSESDRILHLDSRRTADARDNGIGVSMLDFQDWRRDQRAFEDLGAWSGTAMNLTEPGRLPERFRGTYVSANTFRLLGQQTMIGRDFAPDEDRAGAEPVVILGYGVWRTRYGGDHGVIGRVIRVNEVAATIVGVMPEGMKFPTNSDLWQPLVPVARDEGRDFRRLNAFGRLRAGASPAQAEAEFTTITERLAKQHPGTNKDVTVLMMTFNERFNGGRIRLVFLCLLGAVGFVLLIACANVANLLLSRSVHRTREVAVRMALGASRWQIVRQLLIESVLLAGIGGLAAVGLSAIGVRLFDRAVADVGKPYWIVFSMDWVVFGYLAVICLVTGVVFGIVPAFQVSKTNVNDVLKEGGRGQAGGVRARRFTSVLVVCQIALTLVLLTGAGLMIRSFLNLYRLDLGLETTRILTMRVNLPEQRYPDADARRRFHERLSAELAHVAGADSVTVTSHPPIAGAMRRSLDVDGRPVDKATRRPSVSVVLIGDRYFATLGLSLRRGREFAVRDGTPGAETAIVNERFVARFFPGEEPIGRRIRLQEGDREIGPWVTIVGVSPTVRQGDVQDVQPDAVVFLPYRLEPAGFASVMARGRGEPTLLATPLRRAVQAIDGDLPVFDVKTFDAILMQARWPYTVFGTMFALLAVIALVMSSVGIYAVMAYSVNQRRQEIGIRMALGAATGNVAFSVLRGGLIQLAVGVALGLAGAYGVSQLLATLVVQFEPTDPVTFVAVVTILAAVTVGACLIPARSASRVDPLVALRAD